LRDPVRGYQRQIRESTVFVRLHRGSVLPLSHLGSVRLKLCWTRRSWIRSR
jgi:hypothetical protein